MQSDVPQDAYPIEDLWEQADDIPEDLRKEIRPLLLSAEFRRLRSRDEQMLFIRCQPLKFPYAVIATLFKLSASAAYRAIRKREKAREDYVLPQSDPLEKPGPNLALTLAEEQVLIAWIESRQLHGDCPSAREVRDQASILFRSRSKDERAFGKHWWRSFKSRHAEHIDLVMCQAQEPARTAVQSEHVAEYFSTVFAALSRCVTPRQILNMDESGVTARPFKGRKRKVVFLKHCPISPKFLDIRDVSHVSVVGTISLGLTSLPPLFLTTSNVAFKSHELLRLRDEFFFFRTEKGYMTTEAMKFYVNSILAPYVQSLRDQFSDQTLNVYLVADNHGTHTNREILALFEHAGVIPIWLPPHSSHFLQPLDLSVFGSFKSHYANLRTPNVKPQLEGKILRVLHAWHQATYVGCVDAGWRRGAIDVKPRSRGPGVGVLNIRRMNEILEQNCPDGEEWLRTESS